MLIFVFFVARELRELNPQHDEHVLRLDKFDSLLLTCYTRGKPGKRTVNVGTGMHVFAFHNSLHTSGYRQHDFVRSLGGKARK